VDGPDSAVNSRYGTMLGEGRNVWANVGDGAKSSIRHCCLLCDAPQLIVERTGETWGERGRGMCVTSKDKRVHAIATRQVPK